MRRLRPLLLLSFLTCCAFLPACGEAPLSPGADLGLDALEAAGGYLVAADVDAALREGDVPSELVALGVRRDGMIAGPSEAFDRFVYVTPETYRSAASAGGPFSTHDIARALGAAAPFEAADAAVRIADPYVPADVAEARTADAFALNAFSFGDPSGPCEPDDIRISCHVPPPEPEPAPPFVVEKGDVVVGWRTRGNPFGHSGVVYRGGDPRDVRTINIEARGWAGQAEGVETPEDEVSEVPFKTYFMTSDVYRLRVARAPISQARRFDSADWAKAQDPDLYMFPSPMWDLSRWYCSKLNWAALKHGAGYDLGEGWTRGSYNPSDLWTTTRLTTVYREGT